MMSRKIGLFVLSATLLVSIAGCPPSANVELPDAYYGEWATADPEAEIQLTRLIIERTDEGPTVHLYGKCDPDECDWGTAEATYEEQLAFGFPTGIFELTCQYDSGYAVKTVYIEYRNRPSFGEEDLLVQVYTDFDYEGREDISYDERFQRSE